MLALNCQALTIRTLTSELGNYVENISTRPRIYVDANIQTGVVKHMRQRLRWDVLFVIEDRELRRASDIEHYRLARKLYRTLVSLDHDYFDDQKFPISESSGVIVLSAPDERILSRVLTQVDKDIFKSRCQFRARALPLIGKKIHVHPGWSVP